MDNEIKQEDDTKAADGATLEAALEDTSTAGDQPAPEDAKPKPEPEIKPEPTSDIPPEKRAQFPTRDSAIKSAIHWQKAAGKNAQVSGQKNDAIRIKDGAIESLQKQVAELRQQKTAGRNDAEGAPNADNDEPDPMNDLIDARIAERMPEYLKPLQDDEARRRAKSYRGDMGKRYGESWDGLEQLRQDLIDKWKGGKVGEAEVWQLAVIGEQFLNGQISQGTNEVASIPLVDGQPLDLSGSARDPSKADVVGENKSDGDILQDGLDAVPRVPMGVSRIS